MVLVMEYRIFIADQLAPQLRSLRKSRGLSQAGLARQLGVSQSRIAAIERDPSSVSAGQLLQFLAALNVELVLRDAPAGGVSVAGAQGEW